ncbi:MAG TPA: UDP-N-acetylmuramate dehydrogenase [Psychromonas hadalis]|nr:UDP-N-acetylmuramate dehydrogenase [Psychromonas hadalis]
MLEHNAALKKYNSFAIEASAQSLFHFSDLSQVSELVAIVKKTSCANQPILMLGGGSNILFCDDFNGLVIKIDLKGIEFSETPSDHFITVEAGENWHDLVALCVEKKINGLENLALIPGVVGAAPVQNIGAYGVEFEAVCHQVKMIDLETGELSTLMHDECDFSYRHSIFKTAAMGNKLIVSTTLKLAKHWQAQNSYGPLKALGESVTAKQVFDEVCRIRQQKLPDPALLGNAGSFFKNPIVSKNELDFLLKQYFNAPAYLQDNGDFKLAAGWLIDQAGLKGVQIGGAAVHQDQALVLINKGNATAQDILHLAWHVRTTVLDKFNVSLEHEVRFMNANGETNLQKEMQGV